MATFTILLLNLGGRPNPLLQLLKSVLFMSLLSESVDPGEVLSSGEAEANRKHKHMQIPQKIDLPPCQIIHQRSFSCPFSSTQGRTFNIYRKGISQTETTETTNLFFPATNWIDVTMTDNYIFFSQILISYFYKFVLIINLFIFSSTLIY